MRPLVFHMVLLIVLAVCLFAFPPYGVDPGSVLYACSLVVTLICLWCLVSWRLSGGVAFEPYTLFLIAAICFNAGHILLYAFGVDIPTSVMTRFSGDTSLKTTMLVAIGLTSFHLGGLVSQKLQTYQVATQPDSKKSMRARAVALVGAIVFAISLPAWAFVMYGWIGRVMQYGYFLARFGPDTATGLAHLPELLAEALAPAMIFLLAGSRNNPLLRRSVLVAMLVFGAVTLFTGSKGPAVMAFLGFGWVWHRTIRPLNGPLLATCAIALAVVVIPLTTAIREVAGRDRASITAIADAYQGIDNPVIAFLSETGWTGTTIAHTIEQVPAIRDYDYGQSYLYAGLAVLPNLAGGLHPVKEHGFLADWLVSSLAPGFAAKGGGWGFSFIAEAYANFGFYGAAPALAVIGFLLSRLFAWAQSSSDPAKIAMVGACLCNCLLYARGESGLLLREIVWYALIPYVCVGLWTTKQIVPNVARQEAAGRISAPAHSA